MNNNYFLTFIFVFLWHFLWLFLCDTAHQQDINTRSRFSFRKWIFGFYLHHKILNLISFNCLLRNPCHSRSFHNFVARECNNIFFRVTILFGFTTRLTVFSIRRYIIKPPSPKWTVMKKENSRDPFFHHSWKLSHLLLHEQWVLFSSFKTIDNVYF